MTLNYYSLNPSFLLSQSFSIHNLYSTTLFSKIENIDPQFLSFSRKQSDPAKCQWPVQIRWLISYYGTKWSRQKLPVKRPGWIQVSSHHLPSPESFLLNIPKISPLQVRQHHWNGLHQRQAPRSKSVPADVPIHHAAGRLSAHVECQRGDDHFCEFKARQ